MAADATGEAELGALRMQFDRSMKVEFCSAAIGRSLMRGAIGALERIAPAIARRAPFQQPAAVLAWQPQAPPCHFCQPPPVSFLSGTCQLYQFRPRARLAMIAASDSGPARRPAIAHARCRDDICRGLYADLGKLG